MLELLIVLLCLWLLIKALVLSLQMTWSTAKVIASILFAIAIPMLIGCLLFAGGLVLLIPAALLSLAFCLLKTCT